MLIAYFIVYRTLSHSAVTLPCSHIAGINANFHNGTCTLHTPIANLTAISHAGSDRVTSQSSSCLGSGLELCCDTITNRVVLDCTARIIRVTRSYRSRTRNGCYETDKGLHQRIVMKIVTLCGFL